MIYLVIGIISGIISGIICSILIWIFNSLFNISAKKDVCAYTKRLKVYLDSINNDITWGAEDSRLDYYTDLLNKVHFAYLYIDNSKQAIRKLNFRFHSCKAIITQYDKIETGLNKIMEEVELASPAGEKIKRLCALAKEFQTTNSNILSIRANFILNLINCRTFPDALERSCIDDCDEMRETIRKCLSEKNSREESEEWLNS